MDRQRVTNILLVIIAVFIIGVILKLVEHVITALLIALLLAYLMDTFIVFMRRIRVPAVVSYVLTIVIFLGLFMGVGYLVFSNLREFQRDFPRYEYRVLDIIQQAQKALSKGAVSNVPFDPIAELKKLPLATMALKTVQSIFRGTLDFIIVFFFSVLIVLGKHQFIRNILKTFPRSTSSRVPITLSHIDKNLRRYLAVKSFVSLLAATLETAVLLAFHVKFAVIWGCFTFILNFIPAIGAILATVVPTLFAIAQFTDPFVALWLFICIVSIHMVVGNVLDPTLMGETLNLSLLVVFVSLFFWGWLWGPVGVLLAVPMTATIKIILQNIPSTAHFAVFLEKTRGHRTLIRRRKDRSKEPDGDGPDSPNGPIVDKRISQSL